MSGFFQLSPEILSHWRQSVAFRIVDAVFQFTWYAVVAVIVTLIVLMLARFIMNYTDMNPFTRPVIWVRRLTDPFINPIRRALAGFGIQPNGAPLIAILLAILVGYCILMLVINLLNTTAGIYVSVTSGRANGVVALIGYVLYGLLSLYTLMIILRIVLTWGRVSYVHPIVRFLINTTDPILVPLRQRIPPLGMFDISPIVAFIIIWLLQYAVSATLLRDWPIAFIG